MIWQCLLAFTLTAYSHKVTSLECDVARAGTCIQDLKAQYNTVVNNEGRTNEDVAKLCAMALTTSNISMCVNQSVESCNTADVQAAKTNLSSVTTIMKEFCENECTGFSTVTSCLDSVDTNAIKRKEPSAFCRTYNESQSCVSGHHSQNCKLARYIFQYGQKQKDINFYTDICQSECSNLDESASIISSCHPRLEGTDPENPCPAHWNFTDCLGITAKNNPRQICKALIPEYANAYNYPRLERLCPDKRMDETNTSCDLSRGETCFFHLQNQYDSTMQTYFANKTFDMSDLKRLCLVPLRGSNLTECYTEATRLCTDMTSLSVSHQWQEVNRDITELCSSQCAGYRNLSHCKDMVDYSALAEKRWSAFCRSYKTATSCVEQTSCSLNTILFKHLIKPEANGVIKSFCKSAPERCFSKSLTAVLNKTEAVKLSTKTCVELVTASACLISECGGVDRLAYCTEKLPQEIQRHLKDNLTDCQAIVDKQIQEHKAIGSPCVGGSISLIHSSMRSLYVLVAMTTVLVTMVS